MATGDTSAIPLQGIRRGKDFIDNMATSATDTVRYTGNLVTNTYREVRYFIAHDLDDVILQASILVFKVARVAVAVLLFASNSSVFAISVIVGMSNPPWMKEQIDDIQTTWQRIRKDKDYPLLGVLTTAAVLAWPITFAVGAFYLGGYFGIYIKDPEILKLEPKQKPTPADTQMRQRRPETSQNSDSDEEVLYVGPRRVRTLPNAQTRRGHNRASSGSDNESTYRPQPRS